ncbi:hypothetical protein [Streptosporangium sp. CA-115845]|uniref:hypothetical protein n=1 Tax=Streptosporangium sp. CA-115845 TaxID=3240071 RepID=UPI003D8FA37E
MITSTGERYFSATELGDSFGPGVVSNDERQSRLYYEQRDPVIALRAALAVARRSWVHAVAVICEQASPVQASLAVTFAEHLHQVRRARGLHGACVTSARRPDLPSSAMCRIPHLATIEHSGTPRHDVVVWEVMSRERLGAWLGHTTVDLNELEQQLPYLVALRRNARQGRLPDTAAARELRALLDRRYLSILMVLQHPDLFSRLLSPKGARGQLVDLNPQ